MMSSLTFTEKFIVLLVILALISFIVMCIGTLSQARGGIFPRFIKNEEEIKMIRIDIETIKKELHHHK